MGSIGEVMCRREEITSINLKVFVDTMLMLNNAIN